MKITFRGWGREVYPHVVTVEPVAKNERGRYHALDRGGSLTWDGRTTALGKVNNLALSGAFLAEFEFTPTELRNWLVRYLEEKPDEAIRIISEAQGEVVRERDKLKRSLQLAAEAIRAHKEALERSFYDAEAGSAAEKQFKKLDEQLDSSLRKIDRDWQQRW